jgi:hypothetical protein
MKLCTKCGETKPLTEFSISKKEKHYKQYRCKACNYAYRQSRKEEIRNYQLQYKFGVSRAEYNKMLSAQNNTCKICKSVCPTGRLLAVDHDHTTGVIRGLLCAPCNTGLGFLKDDISLLEKAIEYLKESNNYATK